MHLSPSRIPFIGARRFSVGPYPLAACISLVMLLCPLVATGQTWSDQDIQLDVPAFTAAVNSGQTATLPASPTALQLTLTETPDLANLPGLHCRGEVVGHPDSTVRVSTYGDSLYGYIRIGSKRYLVWPHHLTTAHNFRPTAGDFAPTPVGSVPDRLFTVGIEADHEHISPHGSDFEIGQLCNLISGIFLDDLRLHLVLVYHHWWTTNTPYWDWDCHFELDGMLQYWDDNGLPTVDMRILLANQPGNIAGAAGGHICNPDSSCWSEGYGPSGLKVVAHEMGHALGAYTHDPSSPYTIMKGGTGWNSYAFSDSSRAAIFDRLELGCLTEIDGSDPGGGDPPLPFVRGDCSGNGTVSLSDAIMILSYLFAGGDTPLCRSACDGDGNDAITLSDTIYLLGHLFTGGPAPGSPYPACGVVAGGTPNALLDCLDTLCLDPSP